MTFFLPMSDSNINTERRYDTLHIGRSSIDLYANDIGASFTDIKSFAAGFLCGYVKGWDWYRSARLGNACGAIVVTKHGCANFMPSMPEVEKFAQV